MDRVSFMTELETDGRQDEEEERMEKEETVNHLIIISIIVVCGDRNTKLESTMQTHVAAEG